MTALSKKSDKRLDPLYVIFEQHLYNFQDSEQDRKTFIYNIIQEYLTYLRHKNLSVPRALEPQIVEELFGQVNTMLVKKIYGALSIQDYQKGVLPAFKRQARSRYRRLKKSA